MSLPDASSSPKSIPQASTPIETGHSRYSPLNRVNPACICAQIFNTSQWRRSPTLTPQLLKRCNSSRANRRPSQFADITRPLEAPRSTARNLAGLRIRVAEKVGDFVSENLSELLELSHIVA